VRWTAGEATTWTAEDVVVRIRKSLPAGWAFSSKCEAGWWQASLVDAEGVGMWAGEHPDPKVLYLDALGWLTVRDQPVQHPVWKPRTGEVPLHRPEPTVMPSVADPADLDPDEVAAVYKTTR